MTISQPRLPYEDMPATDAQPWDRAPLARFLEDLERLEDATAQFAQVAIPDLIGAGLTAHIYMLMDRMTNTVKQVLTAIDVVGREQGPPR